MTPISNPRCTDYTAAAPSLPDSSPSPAIHSEIALGEDASTDQGVRELLQVVATCQGRLDYCCSNFTACRQKVDILLLVKAASHAVSFQITFLEEEKEEIEKKLDLTKRKLDETELLLQEANADRESLRKWVDKLRSQVDAFYSQFGLLRVRNLFFCYTCWSTDIFWQQMAHANPADSEE